MQSKTNLILFIATVIIHLLGIILAIEPVIFWSKPFLMITLALYFYSASSRNVFTRWMMLGLIFSFGGDVALLFQANAPIYFILGLASFLIAHLCYAYAMFRFPKYKAGLIVKKTWWSIPLLIYGVGLVTFLWSGLGEMTVPVVVYSIVIMLMGLSAVNMLGRTAREAAILIIIGALLFILSDSFIALNKFKSAQLSLPNPRLLIMLTYITGQFLIVRGALKSDLYQN